MARPFKDLKWPDLAAKVKDYWDDPTNLKFILAELAWRKKNPNAPDLREKVRRRLADIPQESPLWLHTDAQVFAPKSRPTLLAPRYPRGISILRELWADPERQKLVFPSEEKVRDAWRFCSRYRLAASFSKLELQDYGHATTGEAYGAIFRVFLCYSAFELMLKVIEKEGTPLSQEKYRGGLVFSRIEKVPKCREFLMTVKKAHDHNRGKRISEYLNGNQSSFSVVDYAKAIRDAFAHGRLVSASDGIGSTCVISICTMIAEHLLQIMNHEFEAALRGRLSAL